MEQNFQTPRNPGGTEHVQNFFSIHAQEPGNEATAYPDA